MVLEDIWENEPIVSDSSAIDPEKLHEIKQLPLNHRLAQLRVLYGYTQDELTNELKVTKSLVSKWETAFCKPSAKNIMKLSILYNLPLSFFNQD